MNTFLYIAEGCARPIVTRGELVERGLFAVVGRGFQVKQLGGGRCMVADGRALASEMVEESEKQTWGKWGDGITFGRWNGVEVQPEGLRREWVPWRTVPVPMGREGSGDAWEIPVLTELAAEGVGARTFLPVEMMFAEGGWSAVVEKRYARLESLLQRFWWGVMVSNRVAEGMPDGMLPLMLEEQAEIVREALGLVYRIAGPEIGAMRLLTPDSMQHALCAMMDLKRTGEALMARSARLRELEVVES